VTTPAAPAPPAVLPPAPGAPAALAAVWTAQVARVRGARGPLLFVATLQSLGLLVLLRGVVDRDDAAEARQVVAGATVLVVAYVALNLLAQHLGALRADGGLDHFATLPVPPVAVVLGTAAAYATFTLPGTAVVATTGVLLYDLPAGSLWVVLPVVAVGGAALAGLGALVGLLAPRPELATVLGQLGMSAVLFLGLVRPERMPLVVRTVRAALPSSYAVDAMREALRADPSVAAVAGRLAVCAAVGVVALAAAAAAFRPAVRR
jgi:ABC-2 type transport system permease protein